MKKVVGAALFGAFALCASFANAASWYQDGSTACDNMNVDPNADDCYGMSLGNAQNVDVNDDYFDDVQGLFGHTDWSTIQVVGSVSGDMQSGQITIDDNDYGMVAVLLKSSREWAGYLFEDGLSGDLDFWTANSRGLSNYVVVGRLADVPLPAGGFLLVAGLAGLGLMRRRK